MGRAVRIPGRLIFETDLPEAKTPAGRNRKTRVNTLKFIYLTIIQLVRQVWFFPRSVANALEQRRQQVVRNDLEAERLDRIRHPDKYLGK